MNQVALGFYSGAALTDIAGAALGVYDLVHRVGKLRRYAQPVSTQTRMMWNVDSDVISKILAAQQPAVIEAQTRAAFNELTDALYEERKAREASEARVAQLAGAGDSLWRLGTSAALVMFGVFLGAVGNLASTIGR